MVRICSFGLSLKGWQKLKFRSGQDIQDGMKKTVKVGFKNIQLGDLL